MGHLAPVMVASRCGIMFAVGAVLWLHRGRVPFSSPLAWLSSAAIVVGAFTPDYQLIAAPAGAYLCIYVGLRLGDVPRLRLPQDLPYGVYIFSFPVQQALLLGRAPRAWPAFTTLSLLVVLPIAAVS